MPDSTTLSALAEINPRTVIPTDLPVSFIGMDDVSESFALKRTHDRYPGELGQGYTRFREGDLLFAKITPCMENGKGAVATGLANGYGMGSTEFHVLRAHNPRSTAFVAQWLSFDRLRLAAEAQMTGSAGQRRVPSDFFHRFRIPSFSLLEQQRVAEILDTVDEQISSTERIITKLGSVQIGLMRSLLGTHSGGNSNGIRQRDIAVPPGWRSASLADIVGAPITYGIVQAGPHVPGGVPYVRTGDMSGDRLSIEGMLRTSRRIANGYARSTVHVGELVCAIRATVGKVLPVPPELDGANLTQGTARIAPGRFVDPRFLYWEMCGERVQEQIALAIKGTTFFEITLAALRQVRIAMPDLPAQREIAEVLDTNEDLVRRERDLLTHLKALKTGLTNDLLTGRVRVPEGAVS